MTKPFVHNALFESSQVGAGTRVWAFAHIFAGARIGADCNTCDHVFLENDVKSVEDMRGSLSVGEFRRDIPFEVPLVLTSQHYDNADYVRDDYDFLKLASSMPDR